MAKISKALFALMLSCVLSFSTVASSLPALADEVEQTTEEDESENVQETTTDKSDTEVSEPVENTENNVSQEEVLGSSDMMDYFLVNMPIVNSNDTQKLVLSLKNAEGYSNFKVSVKKSDGTSFDMEATSQEGNLVEFSRVFTEKGEYTITTLHYVYNGQAYYLNLGDLDMDVKFGVDQEYSGYDPSLPDLTAGTTSDEGVVQVTDLNKAEEQVEDGILSSNAASAIATIGEDVNARARKEVTICLDPGHGGSDGGAIAVNGANEKDLTLKIAKYCKQELEKYDCKVFMTRYDDRDVDLKERAIIARNNGADYLISIHLNSSSPGAMGAEVYYPNSNYRPDLGQNGQAVAQSIQNELAALGIYNRGIKIRNLDPGEMPYPDGSIGDYYAVIRHAKNFGMTGMIIEHCFLSNSSDFYNFLSSDSKLQALGKADAKGIVNALGLQEARVTLDRLAAANRNALPDGTYEIASDIDPEYVLNIAGSSSANKANLELYEANGSKTQSFTVSHDSKGYITITNDNSGKVLDIAGSVVDDFSNVQQYESNGSYAQKWIAVKKNDGSYELVSGLNHFYCLDLYASKAKNGTNVDIYHRNDSEAQGWIFRKQEDPKYALNKLALENKDALADGTYEIASKLDSDYVLDIESASLSNKANVQLLQANYTKSQSFTVSHDSNGFITITNGNSGKVLEVASDKAGKFTNVQQNDANGSSRQKWVAIKKNDGSYELVSALSRFYCLDLYASKTIDGNNVDIYTRNDSEAQNWFFKKQENPRIEIDQLASDNKSVLTDGIYTIASAIDSNYVLDMTASSLSNGGNVQIYKSNQSSAQGWVVSHDSKGYVIITNENSGKVMEVAANKANKFINVQQNQANDSYRQKWIAIKKENGSIELVSALNIDYSLDLYASKTVNESNVEIYSRNNSTAQQWLFKVKLNKREVLDQMAVENKSVLNNGEYEVANKLNTDYVLDMTASSLSDGGNVQLYKSNGTNAQRWVVSHDNTGYIIITNKNSGKAVEVVGNSAKNFGNVQQNTMNDSYAQKWIAVRNSDGSIELVSALDENYCLDLYASKTTNGNNVDIYERNSSDAQQWIFKTKIDVKPVPSNYDAIAAQNKAVLPDGNYEIGSKLNTNYVLDMTASSLSNGGNVQIYESNSTNAQCWNISHDTKGYVIIKNKNSGKVVEVADNKAANFANVQQNQANDNMGQKWIAFKKSDGSIELVSALNMNYCLDLYASKTVNGNNVDVYERNGSNAQLWKFQAFASIQEKTDLLAKENANLMEDGVYFIKNVNTQYVLDVPSSSKNPGVNIQLYTLNESNAQKWVIEHDSKGYVSFMNFGSKLYLTASNGKVTQEYATNEANQKWIVCFDVQGHLKIVSAADTKIAMDVTASNFSNGARIQTYSSNNTSAQQWVFTFISEYKREDVLTPIMGKSLATVDQMVNYYNANASGYDTFKGKYEGKYDGCLAEGGASTIREFAQIFYEEASAEGVRAEVAFVQCMKETAFLKYGGDVLPNQYNYAGIGATGAIHGAEFKDVRTGIRAQIQHLKAYASLDRLVNTCVDPRFNLVTRGCAEYVEWLGRQENPNGYGWASDKNYGYSIVDMLSVLLNK